MCLLQWSRSWSANATDHAVRCGGTACVVVLPQVQFLDKVVDMPVVLQRQVLGLRQYRKLWNFRSCSADTGVDVPVVQVVDWVSCWRCLKFSSSPEFVDLPVCTETKGAFSEGLVAM